MRAPRPIVRMLLSCCFLVMVSAQHRGVGGGNGGGRLDEALQAATSATAEELTKCFSWADVAPKRPVLGNCSLATVKAQRGHVRRDGTYAADDDAVVLCQLVSTLQAQGVLPSRASPTSFVNKFLIDIGAAYGGELVIGHGLGFPVVSFEARKSEYDILHSSYLEKQKLQGVRIVEAAVSNVDTPSSATIFAAGHSSSLHASAVSDDPILARLKAKEANTTYQVTTVSLDHVMRSQLGAVAVLKIDTQGHEFEVLASSIRVLRASRPVIKFEYDTTFRGAETARSLCLLKALGMYTCWHVADNVEVWCLPIKGLREHTDPVAPTMESLMAKLAIDWPEAAMPTTAAQGL